MTDKAPPPKPSPGELDRTMVGLRPQGLTELATPALEVSWMQDGKKQHLEITEEITVGRGTSCDVQIIDNGVSRKHLRIFREQGQWQLQDLDSANGSFLDGVALKQVIVPPRATVRLGSGGPKLWLRAQGSQASLSESEIAEHYLGDRPDDELGYQTMIVRQAYRAADKKQKRHYRSIIACVALLLVFSAAVGAWQYLKLQETRELATEIFYNMKSVEVQLAQTEDAIIASGDASLIAGLDQNRDKLRELETQYDHFLDELGVLGPEMDEQDRLILRVARIFGECELNMPPEFREEVINYIGKWKRSARLRKAIARANAGNLGAHIYQTMVEQHLPPQFLYVALQESGFKTEAVGPKTRFGIAKGMWQFIPTTARRYGLQTGPLLELPRFDPRDQRHDPELSTVSAAKYLRDIYSKDAQASALLAIASYNWGPYNIRKRIRDMPNNPRERNFWQLLKQREIPDETYDYVFFIFSAAVIGENPGYFGFKFENPLTVAEQLLESGIGDTTSI